MLKIFVGLFPSMSNHFMLKIHIMNVLNPQRLLKNELLFAILVRHFHLKERQHYPHTVFFVPIPLTIFIKTFDFIWNFS